MADLTRTARALDPAEAAALATEALPLDNEAVVWDTTLERVPRDDAEFEGPGSG